MNLSPTTEQKQIVDAARLLLERHAGPERAKALRATDYDHGLDARLDEAGFLDVMADAQSGVEAGLVTLEVAKAAGAVSYMAGAMVCPALLGSHPKVPVALARRPADFPVRFAQHARLVLLDAGDEAQLLEVRDGDVEASHNDELGWPLGKLAPSALARARGWAREQAKRFAAGGDSAWPSRRSAQCPRRWT